MNHQETLYTMALTRALPYQSQVQRQLLDAAGSATALYEARSDIRQIVPDASERIASIVAQMDSHLSRCEAELNFDERNHIRPLLRDDADYPARLHECQDAPVLLFYRGNADLNQRRIISIVGTRKATEYGRSFCQRFLQELAVLCPDVMVVSGLAYGIDIAAHRACLKHGLSTVAVMARGLNGIYPAMHRSDAVRIVQNHGLVVTDYLSSDEIHRSNFLARNRIIAALSDCTVIVESADHGGSLVTASLAQSYNRDVMAVPGRVGDEFSRGCNRIIRTSLAMAITCADELIEAMGWDAERKAQRAQQLEIFPTLNKDEQAVVDLLKQQGDVHINTLATSLGVPIYRLMSTLVELDCRGVILTMPGCRYCMR